MRFLLVRLSSMGDVVLTTPLIRALHRRFPEAEIHFLTRRQYKPLLQHHPQLTAVHEWPPANSLRDLFWEGVIDLQKNLRTFPLRWQLQYRAFSSFPKENFRKWLMVRFKKPFLLRHVVERYGRALRKWDISPDELGPLEVYVPEAVEEKIHSLLLSSLGEVPRVAVGLGGTYKTKRWLIEYYEVLLNRLKLPVILLGGESEAREAESLARMLSVPVVVGAGRFSLLETAAAIRLARLLISHDTGTAHLGAAMGTPTAVLWGNTVPEFGMTPWKVPHTNIEVKNLSCRPCSKLGYSTCPRGHHDCIRALTPDYVEKRLREAFDIARLV
ncbi:MAG: glycosyltransferase family 9 protein [Bacteroidia bacterium]|nr:glycosyltransferase family 9 protein [Bacteroidia bacterium]MCX7764695.1 glycosyltransferase family 9 protein [Bacteroidia bacterium]MDW8057716.1 glycosyltransferase family 9 protein [Bacteroidia bacterium]